MESGLVYEIFMAVHTTSLTDLTIPRRVMGFGKILHAYFRALFFEAP